jgi:hypothetical protein
VKSEHVKKKIDEIINDISSRLEYYLKLAECPCVATAYLSIFYRKYKYMHEIHVEITTYYFNKYNLL